MFRSSLDAEAAFYEAFSNGDLEAMMQVWAGIAEIACIHPSGPRLEGPGEVRASWAEILAGDVVRSFELRGRQVSGGEDVRVHILEENITVPGTAFVAPPVLATNVYRLINGGWFLVLHHASVAPAAVEDNDPAPPADGSQVLH
ncbi:MAG: nuclear transport factor 2 family protein [Gammaproteobacteria bacterium]